MIERNERIKIQRKERERDGGERGEEK